MNTLPSSLQPERGSDPAAIRRFAELKSGDRAIVVSLEGNAHDVARLSEIGFRRGAEFTLVRCGSTAIVRIHHQSLCLRMTPDIEVQVQLLPASS